MKNRFVFLLTLMSLAASTTFISCQKEEQDVTNSFSATMEDCTDREDKTSLVNNRLFWESGDEVMIYGSSTNGVFTAEPNAHNATQAEFVGSTNLGSAPYYAIYPASIAVDLYNSVDLHAVQVSPDGSPKGIPMYAQTNNRTLHFHNLCGLLKLHLTKPGVTISSVTFVADEGTVVSGGFSVANINGHPQAINGSGRNWVRLQCTTPQSIATGGDFYIYLPAGNYQNFRIEIRTSDGQICTKTSNAPKTLVIERSYCTTITLGSDHLIFVPDLPAELVDGRTFNAAIPANATAVVFEYNSPDSSDILLSTSDSPYPIYGTLDGTTWRVSTFVSKINANPDCSSMFREKYYITTINFGEGFNTLNVTDMNYMFWACNSLINIDVSSFNTGNVTNMSYMFNNCHNLENLDLSSFNTSRVTNMEAMFSYGYGLSSLDLSNFNTSSVTNMMWMFSDCHNLTSLDLSGFDMSNVTIKIYMCEHLSTTSGHCTITSTEAVETAMLSGTNLPTSGVTFTWLRPSSSK